MATVAMSTIAEDAMPDRHRYVNNAATVFTSMDVDGDDFVCGRCAAELFTMVTRTALEGMVLICYHCGAHNAVDPTVATDVDALRELFVALPEHAQQKVEKLFSVSRDQPEGTPTLHQRFDALVAYARNVWGLETLRKIIESQKG